MLTITLETVLGITDDELIDFTIYPNLTSGQFTVSINKSLNQVSASIYDLIGKQVGQLNNLSNQVEIDLFYLIEGLYLIRLTAENGLQSTQGIVIQ